MNLKKKCDVDSLFELSKNVGTLCGVDHCHKQSCTVHAHHPIHSPKMAGTFLSDPLHFFFLDI